MARFSVGLLFVLATNSLVNVAALSLEDKWQELETKLDAKVIHFEEKVTQLETQLEQNNKLRQDLTLKVVQLEAKNVQLETKVQEQEKILTFLLQATELPISADGSKWFLNNRQTAIRSTGKMSEIPRTCRELRATDPTLPSGMYWIDPDGDGEGGDESISVYCDMTSGSTSILHDSESAIDVGHCSDPGCYSRSISYNASIRQMKALAEISAECHQSIKYDCYYTPFELNSIAYAWWNDRDGNGRYFWAGNNTDGKHTCQCGIDGNCVDSVVKCNCDTISPIQLFDDGVITDKNVLPVTRLNFGRTLLETSSGIHTLGRFVCTGTSVAGLPTSCEDLWRIGHSLNGFYSVMGTKMMESVFCDFNKLPDDAGFQKWIGYADVKSAPVYFYVQRNSSFTTIGKIPFHSARVNEGNAMDLNSGNFTAPRRGIYFFSFTGVLRCSSTSTSCYFRVGLYLNSFLISSAVVSYDQSPLSLQSTMNLIKGDQVWVQIEGMTSGAYLYDFGTSQYPPYPWTLYTHYTHFTGFMLEEEIVASI